MSPYVRSAGSIVLWLYAFGATLVLPWVAQHGLDQSWMVGLGEAARHHLVFGRDIVFTYGPLGYLGVNAAMPETLAAKTLGAAAIAAVFASLLLLRTFSEGSRWRRIVFALAAILIAGITVHQRTVIELVIFYALVLAFTFPALGRGQPVRALAFALGLLTGVFGLVKFSYAAASLVVGCCVFVTRLVEHRSDAHLRRADALALTLYLAGFTLASAGIYTWTTLPLQSWSVSPAIAGYVEFLTRSLSVAQGYSAAMALDAPVQYLLAAFGVGALVSVLAVRERAALGSPRVVAVIALMGFAFKEGFVRADPYHVPFFFLAASFSGCIVLLASQSAFSQWSTSAAAALAFASFVSIDSLNSVDVARIAGQALPPAAASNVLAVIDDAAHWQRRERTFDRDSTAGLHDDALAPPVVGGLRNSSIDVIGNETNVVFANGLKWKPEPVFQPFSAYTPELDALNRDTVRTTGADRELLAFATIDGRYPLGDEPLTFREIVCNNAIDPKFSEPISTSSGKNAFVVLARTTNRCGAEATRAFGTVAWDEPLTIRSNPGTLAFLSANIRYSQVGRAINALYHAPPVTMTVTYADGSTATFRIVIALMQDGVLIDPVPRTLEDVRSLFAGAPLVRVTSVRFSTQGRYCFDRRLEYRLTTVAYAAPVR